MDDDKKIELIDKAISNINEVRNFIYKEQWEYAEALFHALEALYELKFKLKGEEEEDEE